MNDQKKRSRRAVSNNRSTSVYHATAEAPKQEAFETFINQFGPSIIALLERQSRTESMLFVAEEMGVLPQGLNELGDLFLENQRKDEELAALRKAAKQKSVLPIEYAQALHRKVEDLKTSDATLNRLVQELLSRG